MGARFVNRFFLGGASEVLISESSSMLQLCSGFASVSQLVLEKSMSSLSSRNASSLGLSSCSCACRRVECRVSWMFMQNPAPRSQRLGGGLAVLGMRG